jgi:hypothetical protein
VVLFDERGLVVGHEQSTKSVPLGVTFAVSLPTGGLPKALTVLAPQHQWGIAANVGHRNIPVAPGGSLRVHSASCGL